MCVCVLLVFGRYVLRGFGGKGWRWAEGVSAIKLKDKIVKKPKVTMALSTCSGAKAASVIDRLTGKDDSLMWLLVRCKDIVVGGLFA